MRRPLRRLHFGLWVILTPLLLGLIAYALTRSPVDRVDADAPSVLFESEGEDR